MQLADEIAVVKTSRFDRGYFRPMNYFALFLIVIRKFLFSVNTELVRLVVR